MQVDYIIVGQGICGSFMSHYLQQHNSKFVVLDEGKTTTSSKVASGVINPITGRRLVRTWMIEEVLPFAVNAYQQLEQQLHCSFISPKNIIDVFTTPQMKLAFDERLPQETDYLSNAIPSQKFENVLHDFFGSGMINNCWLIDINLMLAQQRQHLIQSNNLLTELFDATQLQVSSNAVQYKHITAKKIIFCDGIGSTQNQWFNMLPFVPNKGEALLVQIDQLPRDYMYKCGVTIVPWQNNLFWVGSTYEWKFEDDKPTAQFKEKTIHTLQQILKTPFKVVDHLSAVRPANIERRPFVGLHPIHPSIGILNGMGTKGCSLAPYFASQFVEHLLYNAPINPLVDIKRFEKILSR
ncbi:MAG: FAD-dependent oxidoreductase [Bacteroidetes bacterium]|nr:FAD-dependent oxidoreductase [Bacteroidota bacterium]